MMPRHRHALPQLSDTLFLTDGGLETTLVFHEKMDLPHFAAFDLMTSIEGRGTLRDYFIRYLTIARDSRAGFIFESPTWRASRDWADKLGYSAAELADVNRASIELMAGLRDEFDTSGLPMVLSGCVGPRGDGYRPDQTMGAAVAQAYHEEQIRVFAGTEVDMITAITMNTVDEAIGIVRAAEAVDMPVAVSFTLETDGRLPTGESLKDAIVAVDRATGGAPAYFMINCAHPSHFADVLQSGEPWITRIRGLRANASKRSHAELDAAPDLDDGNPTELANAYRELMGKLPRLNVLGGCCGTYHRHVEAIAKSCASHAHHAAYAA